MTGTRLRRIVGLLAAYAVALQALGAGFAGARSAMAAPGLDVICAGSPFDTDSPAKRDDVCLQCVIGGCASHALPGADRGHVDLVSGSGALLTGAWFAPALPHTRHDGPQSPRAPPGA